MKATYFYAAGALALTFAIAACVAGPDLPPPVIAPSPTVTAAPAPPPSPVAPPPVQEPRYDNYLDAPQTPGDWIFANQSGGGMALYQNPNGQPLFMLECDRPSGSIVFFRSSNGVGQRSASVQTETTKRSLVLQGAGSGHMTQLAPRDPLLDAMAITKGRFAVAVEGERTLYLPAWAEVTRVIEDCR